MPLRIETFSNVTGGSSFFKAIGHPLAAAKATALMARLASGSPVAIYDPLGFARGLAEFHDLTALPLAGIFVQDIEQVGQQMFGRIAQPVTELADCAASIVFVVAFDAQKIEGHIAHLLPPGAQMISLDSMRVPEDMLTDPAHYLSKFNWATNFGWLRDGDGHHSRIVSANYWTSYGARGPRLWARLFDADGGTLAEWTEAMPPADGTVVIDSRQVRDRFGLGDFCGSLFLHVIGAAGHDVVKYALDTYGDDARTLSCTHDANAWPSDLYAGLPAPREDEEVLLWVQNSHPVPIPPGSVGLNLMGQDEVRWLEDDIPPYATVAINSRSLFPKSRWPLQFEIRSGKHFVRPRYEILAENGRRRVAHANVERSDLSHDPRLKALTHGGPDAPLGKGHILPAPVLPAGRWHTILLPTPMSTAQTSMPLRATVYSAQGEALAEHRFGNLARRDSVSLDVTALVGDRLADGQFGHVELTYDFEAGDLADGWLHALVRYEDRASSHIAETSFGSHMFNTVLTYRNEPQSYHGRAPGLSTRLFLRIGTGGGAGGWDTFCHLIYPASTPWLPTSDTALILMRRDGTEVVSRKIAIRCGGSHFLRISQTFSAEELHVAGDHGYVLVRDTTCRLFGYHGCISGKEGTDDSAFSLDHMFGF